MIGKKSKALGVLLALAMLASMLVVAAPASAGTLAWSAVAIPGIAGNVLGPVGADVSVLAVAPDGLTMFAANNTAVGTALGLYKSTNGGQTWTATNVFQPSGAGPAGDAVPIVAIKISPTYATDGTVWIATQENAWRSTNGGATGGRVGAGLLTPGATQVVTSLDIAPNYATSKTILAGVADTAAAAAGGVWRFSEATLAWTDQTINGVAFGTPPIAPVPPAPGPVVGSGFDVVAVAFSPNFGADGEIMAVATDEVNTYVSFKLSTNAWALNVLNARIAAVVPIGSVAANPAGNPPASIAFPSDYDALNSNVSFVGIDTGAANLGNVWRITGRMPPNPSSLATNTNIVGGTPPTGNDISSVAFNGALASGVLVAGWADAGAVSRSATPSATSPSWTANASGKGPSGASNTIVAVAPDFATSNTVHAGTSGAQSAVSRSTDGGATFNARSLVDTPVASFVINDVALASTSEIFIATSEAAAALGGIWRSSNGGTSWERIWTQAIPMALVEVTPSHATDNVVYATEVATTRIWKSTNDGTTWLGLTAQAPVTDWIIRGPDSLVTGAGTGQVYRTTNSGLTWAPATTAPAAAVVTLRLSPAFTTDNEMLVGAGNGAVYRSTDGGVNFARLGTAGPGTAGGAVHVAYHPDYANNKTVFADNATAGDGVFRWVVGTSTAWATIFDPVLGVQTMMGTVVAPDGTLYAVDSVAGAGMVRSVNPRGGAPVFLTAGILGDAAVTATGIDLLPGSNIIYTRNTAAGGAIRTFTDTLSSPLNMTAPADGASIPFNGPGGAGTAMLVWEAVTGATSYQWDVATDSNFINIPFTAATAGTSVIVGGGALLPGQTYYARVRIATAGGGGAPLTSPLSATRSFTVGLGPAPVAPALVPPPVITGTDRVSVTPVLSWSKMSGATKYQLQLNDTPVFATIIDQLVDGEAFVVPAGKLNNGKTYFWRVRGVMGAATFSEWSPVGAFTTQDKPVVPPATVTITATATPPPAITMPTVTVTQPAPPAATVTAPAPPAVTVTQPAPTITLPAPKPAPTPGWAWVVIVIGAILVVAVIVLVVRTRRVS